MFDLIRDLCAEIIILIPARIGSTRLPGKVVRDINGIEMVIRVAKVAQGLGNVEVFVATDSDIVCNICGKNNVQSIMVQEDCASGTDRINIALNKIEEQQNKRYKYVLNLQADMPNISLTAISRVIENSIKNIESDIETAVAEIKENDENKDVIRKWKKNPGTVKCVLTNSDNIKLHASYRAVFFSREPIPFGTNNYFSHLGMYCYKRDVLDRFCKLKVSPLERVEKLEQLRAIDNDIKIFATVLDELPISVDTRKDLILARKVIF